MRPAEHSGELDLPAGRRQQIETADDEIHVVAHVVDGDRELVRPVAVAVLEEEIAALVGWRLHDLAEGLVHETLRLLVQFDANTSAPRDLITRFEAPAATRPGIPFSSELFSRAVACIDMVG